MATKRDVRDVVADMFLTDPEGLDALATATEKLMTDAMAAEVRDLPRIFKLGRLGGEVLKLKGEVAP